MVDDETARLLDSLAGLRLPDTGGVAPLGWLAGVALAGGLVAVAVMWWRSRRLPVPGRRLLAASRAELDAVRALLGPPGVGVGVDATREALGRVSTLARRIALAGAPRERVASLEGEPWLRALDGLCERGSDVKDDAKPGSPGRFVTGPGRLLATAPYEPAPVVSREELDALLDAVETLAVAVAVSTAVAPARGRAT